MTDNIDDAEEPTLYYVLSLRGTKSADYAIWYMPGSRGYTTNLNRAGKFTEVELALPGFIDGKNCIAVRCDAVDGMAFRVVSAGPGMIADMRSLAWAPESSAGAEVAS